MSRNPIFLERKSYRRRRIMDAVRLLPLFGLGLWLVPLMWPRQVDPGADGLAMSAVLIYIFAVWLMLICLCVVLWWRTRRAED